MMDYVEEEYLLYLDIEPTSLSVNQLRDLPLKIIADEKKILLQNSGVFFEGEFDYSIGTHVFFEKDEQSYDQLYNKCEDLFKFAEKTSKMAKMNRVLLKDLSIEDREAIDPGLDEPESVNHEITKTYEETLNQFLPLGKKQPRTMLRNEENDITKCISKTGEEDASAYEKDDM